MAGPSSIEEEPIGGDPTVQAALVKSDFVILLVSADFIASEYCYEQEMLRAFARQRDNTARVIPIILRPCQWNGVPIGNGETLSDLWRCPGMASRLLAGVTPIPRSTMRLAQSATC